MPPASDVFIDATETDPTIQAQRTLREGQDKLLAELAAQETAAVADYSTGTLRRHLSATDDVLYAAASGAAETRLLVRALRAGLSTVEKRIDALAAAGDAAATETAAKELTAVLESHLAVEREVFLPALAALPGADLPILIKDLQTVLSGGKIEAPEVVDVRLIPHGQRHPRIFARYAQLAPGEFFTLVNNHDPKPLRREFQATYPDAFTWDYVESGPELWAIHIGRKAADG